MGATMRCGKCGAATSVSFSYGKLSALGEPVWFKSESQQEIADHYQAIIPRLRIVAKSFGYALATHGSMLRDLDLVAIPWEGPVVPPDTLAANLQKAACGITSERYDFSKKPHGRITAVFAIGRHAFIDLSVMPTLRGVSESASTKPDIPL